MSTISTTKRFGIAFKMTGSVYVEVDAADEAEAISKAYESATSEDITDWDITKRDADVEELT